MVCESRCYIMCASPQALHFLKSPKPPFSAQVPKPPFSPNSCRKRPAFHFPSTTPTSTPSPISSSKHPASIPLHHTNKHPAPPAIPPKPPLLRPHARPPERRRERRRRQSRPRASMTLAWPRELGIGFPATVRLSGATRLAPRPGSAPARLRSHPSEARGLLREMTRLSP